MSQGEKLQKRISELEARRDELMKKRDQATERANTVEAARRANVAEAIAEGQAAPRESEKQFEEIIRLRQSAEDHAGAIGVLEKKLEGARAELASIEREDAINSLENQIAQLSQADNVVDVALRELRSATEQLFASAAAVAKALNAFDSKRWDATFASHLELTIKRAIVDAVSSFGHLTPGHERPFASNVLPELRAAVAQLRYESLEGRIEPKRGEELFRVLSKISGLRDLVLLPGNLVALTPAEAQPFLAGGSLELVTERVSKEAA